MGNTFETVELRFQYTQSEYIKAERQYLISSKTIHKYDIALVAVFCCCQSFICCSPLLAYLVF